MNARLGIDIGGTFTDFALERDRELFFDKVLSTPEDRSLGVMQGIEKLARRQFLSVRDFLRGLDCIVHGTTVADNTLIERNGARTGLLTTAGFRDEIELRRGYKEDIWDVRLPPPAPLVPRRRRLGVPERIRADGRVHTPLDEAAARLAIRRLGSQGVESIAISTLFSFVDPSHERLLAKWVREELPGVSVSLSHEILPKAPEFERTSTTVVNAYVGPRVSAYLDRLVERLAEAGHPRELLVMQCTGGVMTRDYLRESPIRVLASGPAGGAIGGAHAGSAKGERDLLCVDMGGTSYDVSVVRQGTAAAEAGWNWHHRQMIGLPMVRVSTLGAGGGSLCTVEEGRLRVGPESAGSDPGPICYGRGGRRPTVTDATLLLGLLSEDAPFAGGAFALTREGVAEAFETQLARPLGVPVEQAALDCFRLVNANMAQAVRRLTAERGTDPRELTLLAYGGNGPVFATHQASELGISRILVPRASAAFSALGALAARPAIDEERSLLRPMGAADPAELRRAWLALDERATRTLQAAGHPRETLHARYQLAIRYPGQNWSLPVVAAEVKGPRDLGFVGPEMLDAVCAEFHRRHQQEYGHAREGEEPEITGVRLTLFAETALPEVGGGFTAAARPAEPSGVRRAHLDGAEREVPVYVGRGLAPGHRLTGPALIEEGFTTVVLQSEWEARVDDAGDLRLDRGA